jgi:hypothetical protein
MKVRSKVEKMTRVSASNGDNEIERPTSSSDAILSQPPLAFKNSTFSPSLIT